jgi:hypothetical protein
LHHIEKDLLKDLGSKIDLRVLEPGWHEVFIKDSENSLEFTKNDLAVGVIWIKEK